MAVSNESAVRFCDEQARPVADKLARAKHAAVTAAEQWAQLSGTNDEKLAQMSSTLEWAANRCWWAYQAADNLRTIWRAHLFSGAAQPQYIDNSATEEIWDNAARTAPDPSRPNINGQDVRRLLWRAEEFTNFLLYDNAGSPVWQNEGGITTETLDRDRLEKVFRLTEFSLVTADGGDASGFVSRCNEIKDEYITNHPSRWGHILTVAVNPGPQS